MDGLLSIERKQKLDLLAHLVTNLQGTLILRGDLGSGKSSLLKAAMEQGINNSDILLLNAELSLSFESIQYELLQFLNKKYQLDSRSIADVLLDYERQGKYLVLMIDDASLLLAGLITTLVNYAKEHLALKLVFSLTSEELLTKSQTDNLNNSCHFIELLNLNYSQTSELVTQLIAAGDTAYKSADISHAFLQEMYKESAGNVGVIQDLLNKNKKRNFNKVPFLTSLIALVAIGSTLISIFLWRGSGGKELEVPITSKKVTLVEPIIKIESKRSKIKTNAEIISIAKQFELESQPLKETSAIIPPDIPKVKAPRVEVPQLAVIKEESSNIPKDGVSPHKIKLSEQQKIKKIDVSLVTSLEGGLEVAPSVLLAKKAVISTSKKSLAIKRKDDRSWVLRQKETAYTMQLMALSSIAALLKEQQKFNKIGYSTYYLENEVNKKQVYTLYYGVFDSVEGANKNRLELPSAMQKAWIRKISNIKKNLSME